MGVYRGVTVSSVKGRNFVQAKPGEDNFTKIIAYMNIYDVCTYRDGSRSTNIPVAKSEIRIERSYKKYDFVSYDMNGKNYWLGTIAWTYRKKEFGSQDVSVEFQGQIIKVLIHRGTDKLTGQERQYQTEVLLSKAISLFLKTLWGFMRFANHMELHMRMPQLFSVEMSELEEEIKRSVFV